MATNHHVSSGIQTRLFYRIQCVFVLRECSIGNSLAGVGDKQKTNFQQPSNCTFLPRLAGI